MKIRIIAVTVAAMQLAKFTDYALRTVMHLAVTKNHRLTTRQIAEIHNAKYNHLTKVTQWLVRHGYVASVRGRSGGLELAMAPEKVNIGALVRALESQTGLVECLNPEGGNCRLAPSCKLKHALMAAEAAFYAPLERLTLADLTHHDDSAFKLLGDLTNE